MKLNSLALGMFRSVRGCFWLQKCYFSVSPSMKEDLHSIICRQIRSVGPMSVAEYMKLALHHPTHVSCLHLLHNFTGIL